MLAIFHKAFAHPPEELNSPASQKCSKRPKLPDETLNEFLSHHPENTFALNFGHAAVLAYVRPDGPYSKHPRLFCGVEDIYCLFMGSLNNLCSLIRQYGLSKGSNEAMFVIEAYRTLRDRGPYPAPPSPWLNQRPPLSVDVNVAYVEGRDEADRGTSQQPLTKDFFMMSAGKRKREDFPAQYQNGGYNIPQQDGAGDSMSEIFELEVGQGTSANRQILAHLASSLAKIPQLDGPIPDSYDDMLSTPNIYNYQGVVNEDYNIVNTPAPNDLQVSTPAVVTQNDVAEDDDDEPLNENDDDELDDVDEGEELNTQHLVLAQFDKVTRTKSRWKCALKDGIMHINNKDILFNKATGEFEF